MTEINEIQTLTTPKGAYNSFPDLTARKEIEELKKNGTGNGSGQNLTLDTTLTQSGKAADAKAVGDALDKVEKKIPSIEGLAKEDDIPTKPEDIGAQPAGDYLTKAPVVSVNGKTGAVRLGAADVGARPDTWAPTAQEVGALPSTYTPPNQTAEQVGADPKGTAASAVSEHNTSGDAHTDLRLEVKAIREQLAAFLDVDEETLNELSELIAAIAANQTSIEQLTSGKVNVSDIVNNLVTNVTNKPLSAAQGVELKKLIDNVSASLANYQPKDNYALESAVPTKVSQLQNDAKYLTAVTAAMITAALGYTPINPALATLARHTDGLLYLFVNGKPVGSGVELPTGGIDGYITADKQIIFNNLPDGEYTLAYINDDGDIIPIGALEKGTNIYYSVTKNLTNCTISNSATQVIEGESYSATIAAKSGYELESVTVTMGGNPVTVSGGKITISNVTGNIVITAVAKATEKEPTNFAEYNSTNTSDWNVWINNARVGSDGTYRADTAVPGTGTPVVSNYIAVKQNDVVEFTGFYVSNKSSVVYDSDKTVLSEGAGQLSNLNSHLSDVSINNAGYSGQFAISGESVAFVRIGGYILPDSKPISIKIKRNGEYL